VRHVPGVGPRTAAPLLAVRLGRSLLDLNDEEVLGLTVAEDDVDGLRHLGVVAVACPRRGEFAAQLGQRRGRPLEAFVPRQRVLLGLAGAVVPDQPVSLGGGRLRLVDAEPVDQLPIVIDLVVDVSPARQALANRRPVSRVLAAGARQDGEEPAAVLMDVGHVFGSRELAVGNIEEVAAAGQRAEQIPGALVRAVVSGVAALDPELHRYGTVA